MSNIVEARTISVDAASFELPEMRKRADAVPRPEVFFLESEGRSKGEPHQVDPSRPQSYTPLMPNIELLKNTGNPYPPDTTADVDTTPAYMPMVAVSHATYKSFKDCEGLFNPRDKKVVRKILSASVNSSKAAEECISNTMRDLALYGIAKGYKRGNSRIFKMSGMGPTNPAITGHSGKSLNNEIENVPTNLILYGPPGTGKTYSTAFEAVRLCVGNEKAQGLAGNHMRAELMQTYKRLCSEGRIEFVTFHQSFSYEDFVEGLRPTTKAVDRDEDALGQTSGGFSLQPRAGVFIRISEKARLDDGGLGNTHLDRSRSVFKVSLGRSGREEEQVRHGLENGIIHTGWGGDVDWSDERFDDFLEIRDHWIATRDPDATRNDGNIVVAYALRSVMQVGDYVILADGRDRFRAFGRVAGDYYHDADAEIHPHRRAIEWIWTSETGEDRDEVYSNKFRQHAIYRLDSRRLRWDSLERIVLDIDPSVPGAAARPHVLIIDEINRANISKVFGELITLLEADKRLGAENAIMVRLPNSGTKFGVPANLHIIGTMNTADRSIALLDTALRRRFNFRELMPDPSTLSENLDGIDLQKLLTILNDRIEYLFDREHQIGHAYFTGCKTAADVEDVMRHSVIPLLAEYFYEDWAKIALVLGDKPDGSKQCFLQSRQLLSPSFANSDESGGAKVRWSVKDRFDFMEFMHP